MTVLVDDPLIARMVISRTLPLHESSRRLRELVSGVSARVRRGRDERPVAPGGGGRSPTRSTATGFATCSTRPPPRTDSRSAVAQQLAATFVARRHRSGDTAAGAGGTSLGHGVWRTSGCTWTPRVRSIGSASSTRRCGPCPTTSASAAVRDCAERIPVAIASWRCQTRRRLATWVAPPQPSRAGATVRQALRGEQRGHVDCRDVARRRRGPWSAPQRRYRCWPGPASRQACVAVKPCSTRWSDLGAPVRGRAELPRVRSC